VATSLSRFSREAKSVAADFGAVRKLFLDGLSKTRSLGLSRRTETKRRPLNETSTFLWLTLTATLLASACILGSWSTLSSKIMARAFYFASALMSIVILLWIILETTGIVPQATVSTKLFQILIFRGWMVIGAAIGAVLLILLDVGTGTRLRIRDATRSFITSPCLVSGLCVSVSISFLGTEIGKVAHEADMRQFFVQSGYSVWFLYFIMIAETCGAIGLFFTSTQLTAAFGLTIIMVGAIGTHARNRDPFSDSLEALHLLVLLVCIVLICLLGKRALAHSDDTGVSHATSIGS
jgi:hypothetical protein